MESFHASELFVLAAALYGHDWGMAVSEPEKEYIITGKTPYGSREDELWILPDERTRLKKFAKEQRLPLDDSGFCDSMPIEIWREYVRQTHAFRSGERVRRYFQQYDSGVAEAVARVCIGHWLDFEKLQDHNDYPTDFAILREPVNLRALAIYVRLIDLLDLADDRTPYVIWKFVAPRNPGSEMEWKKHRSLQPITPVAYQEGRLLRVDGSTEDHEVYAALEDLKRWVDDQFRGCNDLLARMNDSRHRLDLYRIDWRISARGFVPISIQFEFDRSRMFEILSEEIYQGDPYVFLRELLQNSIDAIRMRREVLQRKGISMTEPLTIKVKVEHEDNGNALITWKDEGIGMDDYILRNYLAVAGRSYYRSNDFEREDFKMDPISRFGVGMLSCFMVADRIEIETARDPHMFPRQRPLRVKIPAVDKQFRIETLDDDEIPTGTTVRVHIEGNRLPRDKESNEVTPLDITSYLSIVAGFVEFPIAVVERDRRTLILHPHQNPEPVLNTLGDDFDVFQIDLSYQWNSTIFLQDRAIAEEFFSERRWDVTEHLGATEFEGTISYLVPRNETVFDIRYLSGGASEVAIADDNQKTIRMHNNLDNNWGRIRGLSRSSQHPEKFALYKDGILLGRLPAPTQFFARRFLDQLTAPSIRLNWRTRNSLKLDLSRSKILEEITWDTTLRHSLLADIFDASQLQSLDPISRFYRLGFISIVYGIETSEALKFCPIELIPIPMIIKKGTVIVRNLGELSREHINDSPETHLGGIKQFTLDDIGSAFKEWKGEPFLAYSPSAIAATSLERGIHIAKEAIRITHKPLTLRFLHHYSDNTPLAQAVLAPAVTRKFDGEMLRVWSQENPRIMDPSSLDSISTRLHVKFLPFSPPFDHAFTYELKFLNSRHPISIAILKLGAFVHQSEADRKENHELVANFKDCLQLASNSNWRLEMPKLSAKLEMTLNLARRMGLELNQVDFAIDPADVITSRGSKPSRKSHRFGEVLS